MLRAIASAGSYRKMRVRLIELLDSDPVVSIGDFSSFLEPLIQCWDFDFIHFALQVHLASGATRRFGFHEERGEHPPVEEPALRSFLRDPTLSAGVTNEEIESLRRMRFRSSRRRTALFYYRLLQNLRDPLHFRERSQRRTGGTAAD